MTEILSKECIVNIFGHLRKCWNYTYPTGNALEEALFRGIKPFYEDVKSLGSSKTITDVKMENISLDAKGSKKLGHLDRVLKTSNFDDNIFVDQVVPGRGKIKVRVAKSINTQVRRPPVDLKGYKGDPLKILNEGVTEYAKFALDSSSSDGCTEIYSVVCQYGIDKGFKSVFLNITKFSVPKIVTAKTKKKKDGTPAMYEGFDQDGNLVFDLSSFNKGSSNLKKTFKTESGWLYTWPDELPDEHIYTTDELTKTGAIARVE